MIVLSMLSLLLNLSSHLPPWDIEVTLTGGLFDRASDRALKISAKNDKNSRWMMFKFVKTTS